MTAPLAFCYETGPEKALQAARAFHQLDKSPAVEVRKPGIFLLITLFVEHQSLSISLTASNALGKAEQNMEKISRDGKSKIILKSEK